MNFRIQHPTKSTKATIQLPGSKSLSNRALTIKALSGQEFQIEGLSTAKDTETLIRLLAQTTADYYVGDAGTAMRFLTAYLAIQSKEATLSGSQRMHERPIGELVEALCNLGANITYLEKEGFPPLAIAGKQLQGGKVSISGKVSSQFISALLMIGPNLKSGLELHISDEAISQPYIDMTIGLMQHFGAVVTRENNTYVVAHGKFKSKTYTVEPDWSAASYWFVIAALANHAQITLPGLAQTSLQGDAQLPRWFEPLGVQAKFNSTGLELTSQKVEKTHVFKWDGLQNPDLAQSLVVACAGLGIGGEFIGLQSLRIKETDRLLALKNELKKLGLVANTNRRGIVFSGFVNSADVAIETYGDHRMAMAFAPLALVRKHIDILDVEVVEKSYPLFWEDLEKAGFTLTKI